MADNSNCYCNNSCASFSIQRSRYPLHPDRYRANFTMSRTLPFGHGAGCDFLEKPCIDYPGILPDRSKGLFCNSTDVATDFQCDPTYSVLATCNLMDLSSSKQASPIPTEFQYFEDPNMGAKAFRADYCPTYSQFLFTCKIKPPTDKFRKMDIFPAETFSSRSRCFNSDYDRPMCLDTICDRDLRKVRIFMNGESKTCTEDGEEVPVPGTEYKVTCPPLAVMCPDLVCPLNCAGRGRCLWDLDDFPRCECFDKTVTSENCNDYAVGLTATPKGPEFEEQADDAAPRQDEQDINAFIGCREWCADLPLPWMSDNPLDNPKCGWKFSCSGCDFCQS